MITCWYSFGEYLGRLELPSPAVSATSFFLMSAVRVGLCLKTGRFFQHDTS